MELKQHLIHRKYKKAEAASQITIGDDVSIPDGKPDAAKILQEKAEFHVDEVHTEKGKIRVRGHLKLSVLYLTDQASLPAAGLEAEFPFDEILYMEGAATGDNLKLDWRIEELRVSIIHPKKLGVRAIVTLCGSIAAAPEILLAEEPQESSGVYMKSEELRIAEPVVERRDSFRIRDEVMLPVNKPNVKTILWKDLQLRGVDLRLQEGRISIKGEALLFLVYEGEEEEGTVQWLEQAVPFHGTVEAAGVTPEMFGLISTETAREEIELKPDYDGELRMFQIEVLLDIHMHIYGENRYRVLKDAYSTKERLQLRQEETAYERLRVCNQMKCRISAQEKLEEGKILQILGHHAELRSGGQRRTEKGILCEGTLEVQVLYISASDRQAFGCAVIKIPYSQLMEGAEIADTDRWSVSETIEQVYLAMPESGRIEVRASLLMNVCVLEQCTLQNIVGIDCEPYSMEEYKKAPGMRIHFVQPGETLWTIARESRLAAETIRKTNELAAEEVTPGQKLVLVKPAAEQFRQ